jgi:hypothetical protein
VRSESEGAPHSMEGIVLPLMTSAAHSNRQPRPLILLPPARAPGADAAEPNATAAPARGGPNDARQLEGASETADNGGSRHLSGDCRKLRQLRGAPEAVAQACAYFHTDAQTALLAFFSSKRTKGGVIRVAFVDAERRPAIGRSMEFSPCAARFNRTVASGRAAGDSYSQKFGAELLVPRGLRSGVSGHVATVTDVASADYVLIELCNIGRAWSGKNLRDLAPYLMSSYPELAALWRTQRSRFLITLTGDHGPCVQSNEKVGQIRTREWIDESVRGATMLMNEGSTQGGCYTPGTDIVIPTTAVLVEQGPHQCLSAAADDALLLLLLRDEQREAETTTTAQKRRNPLVFFAGKLDSKIRRHVVSLANDHPEFFVPSNLSGDE